MVGVACVFVLLHHVLVVRTDRHRPTSMDNGLVAWVPEELPPAAFAEPGGIWATPGAAVDVVVTSDVELESVDVSLRALVPTRVALGIQGDRVAGTAAPGRNMVERLRPARGRGDADGYAYRVRLYAADGAVPADLFGGGDERHLGVFLEFLDRAPR